MKTPLYKEINIVPNNCCRICRIYVKISGQSKINVFGYNNKNFSQTLSSVLSPVYMTQRDYLSEVPAGSCKVCKSLSIALIALFTSAGAPFASIRGHSLQNSNINMYSGNLARILVWRLHFLFLWNNDARKSHAAQQTLKVRNVLSEVFVDPIDLFG